MSTPKFLRWRQVFEMTGLSRMTIWRMEKKNLFPSRRQLGPRKVGWLEEEVLEWVNTRPAVVPEAAVHQSVQ